MRFAEEVVVLRKNYSIELGCSIQEVRVGKLARSIFLSGQNVDAA